MSVDTLFWVSGITTVWLAVRDLPPVRVKLSEFISLGIRIGCRVSDQNEQDFKLSPSIAKGDE